MSDIVSDADLRKSRAERRLGGRKKGCCVCGETNPHCLEQHHVAGISHHGDLVWICRNCHRKVTDRQKDHPEPPDQSPFQAIGYYLLGLADLFIEIAVRLKEFGLMLIEGPEPPDLETVP